MQHSGDILPLLLILLGGYLLWAGIVNVQPIEAFQLLLQGKDPKTAHPITGVYAEWHNPGTSGPVTSGGTITV